MDRREALSITTIEQVVKAIDPEGGRNCWNREGSSST
jgi:hypothetical protein